MAKPYSLQKIKPNLLFIRIFNNNKKTNLKDKNLIWSFNKASGGVIALCGAKNRLSKLSYYYK